MVLKFIDFKLYIYSEKRIFAVFFYKIKIQS